MGCTKIVVQDRSLHSCLAFLYTIEKISNIEAYSYALKLMGDSYYLPQKIILFDISEELQQKRYDADLTVPSFFRSKDYNMYFREYFIKLSNAGTPVDFLEKDISGKKLMEAVEISINAAAKLGID